MTVTNTSLQAFEYVRDSLGERQSQVLDAIYKLQYCTNTQIAKYLHIPINCVTGRTNELRKKDLVIKSHVSWDPLTRQKATYWKLNFNKIK